MASKKYLSKIPTLSGPLAHWANIETSLTFHLWPAIPDNSTKFCNLLWCVLTLGGIAMKAWLRFIGSPPILFDHLKYGSFLIFFQDLMHWFSEHYANHLSSSRPRLPSKVSSGSIIVAFVRLDALVPFPLLLVFLDPFILINIVHELTYTQIMLGR